MKNLIIFFAAIASMLVSFPSRAKIVIPDETSMYYGRDGSFAVGTGTSPLLVSINKTTDAAHLGMVYLDLINSNYDVRFLVKNQSGATWSGYQFQFSYDFGIGNLLAPRNVNSYNIDHPFSASITEEKNIAQYSFLLPEGVPSGDEVTFSFNFSSASPIWSNFEVKQVAVVTSVPEPAMAYLTLAALIIVLIQVRTPRVNGVKLKVGFV